MGVEIYGLLVCDFSKIVVKNRVRVRQRRTLVCGVRLLGPTSTKKSAVLANGTGHNAPAG